MITHFIISKAPNQILTYQNNIPFDYDASNLCNYTKLRINLKNLEDGEVNDFDRFKLALNQMENIKEIQLSLDIFEQNQAFDVLQHLINEIIPKYKNQLKQITFNNFQVQKKDKPTNQSQKYLLQFLEQLQQLDKISFELIDQSKASQLFQTWFDFTSIFNAEIKNKFLFRMLEIQINIEKNVIQKMDHLNQIPKFLNNLKNLEGLTINFSNFGQDSKYFIALFKALTSMDKLKQLFLNLSNNRMTPTNTIYCIQYIGTISNNIESLAFIDNKLFDAQCIDKYIQAMKRFNNLKELVLEGISFSLNTGEQFFSMLSGYPQLEKLRLDLQKSQLNERDFSYFVKNAQVLSNLNQLYLALPCQNYRNYLMYIRNTFCSDIVKLLSSFQKQLKSLQLILNQNFYLDEKHQLANAFCTLKNLSFLEVRYCQHFIRAESDNQTSIWNQENPQIQYQSFIGENIIFIFYNRLMLEQNSEIQSLTFEYNYDIEINLEDYKKFTKIKSLCINLIDYGNEVSQIIKLIQGVNFHNPFYLKNLTINKKSLELDDIILLIKNCQGLHFLSIKILQAKSEFLKQLFIQLPFLQKLAILEEVCQRIYIDSFDRLICEQTNYLTQFQQLGRFDEYPNQFTKIRYAQLLSILMYQKLIQQQIIYKPLSSHFDLFIY